MDLVLRAECVYNLLGVPHNVAVIDQIAVIIKQLPLATSSAVQIVALTNPILTRKYDELKKYVNLVDEQIKVELSSRQKKYVPNKYNRSNDGNQHQHNNDNNQNKVTGAKQHHNNSIQHNRNHI